mmetsp:Transcript_15174/g.25297  ORF Transcript_15174/g.25297 Transcript_15174/m.25297 type:complete len:236 (-) Transcript_15174:304-1011(-)
MGDSWEDEDFEVPSLGGATLNAEKDNWDDEVDEVEVEPKIVPVVLTAAQITAQKKKEEEADAALESKMKTNALKNETAEERRLREKKMVEEADNELTGELFGGGKAGGGLKAGGGGAAKGLGALVLKTKQDHSAFGTTTATKLAESSTFNVGAFYKTLGKVLESSQITAETLDEILADIQRVRETKVKAVKQSSTAKKSKKDIKKAEKEHRDKFGASDYVDAYDDTYGDMEDDFM